MTSKPPTFSIITATYNAGAVLDRTIASVAKQTCRDFEWIVIDGGSSDNTVDKIKRAANLVHRWLSEPDEGIGDAWNKGLALATGANVVFLNAGDTYDPDFLEAATQVIDGKRIVCCHARLNTYDGRPAGVFRSEPHKLARAMHLAHNWCVVPVEHYRQLGGYAKIPLAMDFDWFHRYFLKFGTYGFCLVNRILGTYYLGGSSDINYQASFQANERILIENGTHRLIARFHRAIYTTKHAIRSAMIG